MKKIFTPVLALAALFATAQTQRLVMIEEFTNASCGPCASQNPAFNTLLAANPTKQVSLKYQTVWPGFDPMNVQNPTEVASRVTYYGVTGVPYTRMDGVEVTGTAYAGAPANLTQAKLDAAYAVSSNVGVAVSHTISNDLDSIYITVTVSNATASALTTANHVLHVGIAEEEIIFPSAPGSNGETDFFFVMRKMLPNANGTALPASIAGSGTWQQTFAVALPSYIYNYAEIAVVAFVQDNGTKSVLNAGYSAKQPVPAGNFDAGLSAPSTSVGLCDANFTPTFTLTNGSTTALTSATISYTNNGGTAVTQNCSGNLAAGASTQVTFAAAPLNSGVNTIEGTVSAPNGAGDYNGMNNTTTFVLTSLAGPGLPAPYSYGIEGAALGAQPDKGILVDPTGRAYVVTKQVNSSLTQELGGFAQSAKSLRVDWYTIPSGTVIEYIAEKVNLTGVSAPKVFFQHAYAPYTSENDKMEVYISKDCGTTWTKIYDKAGTALQTSAAQTARFYPTASQWSISEIPVPSLANEAEALVKFVFTSDFGNSLYLDNIWVGATALGQEEAQVAELNLFPNPANTVASVEFELTSAQTVSYEVVNVAGQVVSGANLGTLQAGTQSFRVDVSNLTAGMYMVRMTIGQEQVLRKLNVQH